MDRRPRLRTWTQTPAPGGQTPSDSPCRWVTVPARLPGASKNGLQLFPLRRPMRVPRNLSASLLSHHGPGNRPPCLWPPPSVHTPARRLCGPKSDRVTSHPKTLPQLPALPGPALPSLLSLPQGDPRCALCSCSSQNPSPWCALPAPFPVASRHLFREQSPAP